MSETPRQKAIYAMVFLEVPDGKRLEIDNWIISLRGARIVDVRGHLIGDQCFSRFAGRHQPPVSGDDIERAQFKAKAVIAATAK